MGPLINPCCDPLFPLYFFSTEYPGDPAVVAEACYELKKINPEGVVKSNRGGWQSDLHSLDDGPEAIKNLAEYVLYVSNTTVLDLYEKQTNTLTSCFWWVNINRGSAYNVAHTHGDLRFIAVYYPQLCSIPGDLCIHSPFTTSAKYSDTATFTPVENRIFFLPGPIMHSVTPSSSSEKDRISIAFNIE